MAYTASLRGPFTYSVGDKPTVEGEIYKDGTLQGSNELAIASIRVQSNKNIEILSESVGVLTSNSFSFVFPSEFTQRNTGELFLSAYVLYSSVTATINGVHTANTTTINLTVSAGSIPDSGWVRVNGSEVMSFTKATVASITVERGLLNTTAAAYTGGESVVWSVSKNTALPNYFFRISSDYDRVRGIE